MMASSQAVPASALAGKGGQRKRGRSQGDRPRSTLAPGSTLAEAKKRFKASDHTNNAQCEKCGANTNPHGMIKCESCDLSYHLACCNIPQTYHDIARDLLHLAGWTCIHCRTSKIERNIAIEKAVTDLTQQLNQMKVKLEKTCTEAQAQKKKPKENDTTSSATASSSSVQQGPTAGGGDAGSAGQPGYNSLTKTQVAKIVTKTINDQARRKKNVIVSGIPESSQVDDLHSFKTLCEEHLSTKPALSSQGVNRLGKETAGGNRHRRLLVHLDSEEAAKEILRSARELRSSQDPYVAANIYINPDLTVLEQKAAYDKRVHRRAQGTTANASQGNGSSSISTSNQQANTDPISTPPTPMEAQPLPHLVHSQHAHVVPIQSPPTASGAPLTNPNLPCQVMPATIEAVASHVTPTTYSISHARPSHWVHEGSQILAQSAPNSNIMIDSVSHVSASHTANQHAHWPGIINHSQIAPNSMHYQADNTLLPTYPINTHYGYHAQTVPHSSYYPSSQTMIHNNQQNFPPLPSPFLAVPHPSFSGATMPARSSTQS